MHVQVGMVKGIHELNVLSYVFFYSKVSIRFLSPAPIISRPRLAAAPPASSDGTPLCMVWSHEIFTFIHRFAVGKCFMCFGL